MPSKLTVSLTTVSGLLLSSLLLGCSGAAGTPSGNQVPTPLTVTSVSPATVLTGSAATTLTVNGTGFTTATVITVAGISETTTYISNTQVTAALPASQMTLAKTAAIAATNGSTASTGTVNLQINNPAPTVTGLSQTIVAAGQSSASITVNGTGFIAATVVQVDGSSRTTTYVSGTQLTVLLTSADMATVGATHAITAVNATPGGGTSAATTLTIGNPVPSISTLAPASVLVGTTLPTTVTVNGAGFLTTSTLQVGGATRAASYVSSSQLTFQLSAADQATATTMSVAVTNAAPAGGTSSAATLTVGTTTATPVLTMVTPILIRVNSPATTISVFGSNLTARSTVLWNGTSLTTIYALCPYFGNYVPCLRAEVPASLITTAATVSITVSSPTATPAVSNALQLTLSSSLVASITSINSSGGPINTPASINITGTGFTSGSSVSFNGIQVPTFYSNSTTLLANVPAADIPTPGIYPVTVSGCADTAYFTAYINIPNNSMVYNPVNGLFYLSVPGAVGPPYANTVVPVDPVTGTLGIPIPVGSEPDRMALSSDGKILWVSLDGASSVRKVDLTTGTAGQQFTVGPPGGSEFLVSALAALPGSSDSVIVSTYYGGYTVFTGQSLAIYDGGVPRTNSITFATYAPYPWALLVNSTNNEIYGPGSVMGADAYITYSYDATGIRQKVSNANTTVTYAASNTDDVQIVGNTLYTDYGQGVNVETGALLGTFYNSSHTAAQGDAVIDATLGKAFILQNANTPFGSLITTTTLGVFNTTDHSANPAPPLTVSIPMSVTNYQYAAPTGNRLTRWGSNGLALRGTGGFVTFRSNSVQDLFTVTADVGVAVTTPSTASTGVNTVYTATVTNNGPSAASSIGVNFTAPSNGTLVSASSTAGTCALNPAVCNIGQLASGASATVTLTVLPLSAGTATLSAQVIASETDTNPSNNSASASVVVTGSTYNQTPTIVSVSPAGILSKASDTGITLTGTNFAAGAVVQVNGTTVQTSYQSPTQIAATIPAADLTTVGWLKLTVVNPTPGGGPSGAAALYIFAVLPVNATHIAFDPYTRKLMAGLGAGTSSLTGNSLVAITPDTATPGTPVVLSAAPSRMAVSSDGQYLYALVPSATNAAITRFNLGTQQIDFTATGFQITSYEQGLRDIAAQPGSPNTVAVDEGEYPGVSIFDFNSTTRVATRRGTASGTYSGTCLNFPDASRLFVTDLSAGVFLKIYPVTSTGIPSTFGDASLPSMNCTKVDGALLFGQAGGVASTSGANPTQLGTLEGMPFVTNYSEGITDFAPDASVGRSFYLTTTTPNSYSALFDSITGYDLTTYLPTSVVKLPFSTYDTSPGFTGVDMVRWGQDGLAILSSGGTIFLVRGPLVVPGLLTTGTTATLTSSSSSTLTHGSANTLLTLTGTNLQPGVAVTWNGSYRTTTRLSSTQVTVAIPASDLLSAGSAALVATNPGATASSPLTITIP